MDTRSRLTRARIAKQCGLCKEPGTSLTSPSSAGEDADSEVQSDGDR